MFCFDSCIPYVPDPENTNLLKTALGIYRKFNQYADALFVAIQLNDIDLIKEIYESCLDKYVFQLFISLSVNLQCICEFICLSIGLFPANIFLLSSLWFQIHMNRTNAIAWNVLLHVVHYSFLCYGLMHVMFLLVQVVFMCFNKRFVGLWLSQLIILLILMV